MHKEDFRVRVQSRKLSPHHGLQSPRFHLGAFICQKTLKVSGRVDGSKVGRLLKVRDSYLSYIHPQNGFWSPCVQQQLYL